MTVSPTQTRSPAELVETADALFAPGSAGRSWYVLHTRPRCEKRAAAVCQERDIRHCLPLHRSEPRRKKGQRRYSFDVPLFPGYMFACCDDGERYQIMRTNHLVRTIDVVDQAQLLSELRNIYLAANSDASLTLYPQLRRGRYVRVIAGPLTGVTGRISRRKEGLRLVLNVSILGTAVAAELDMSEVELAT
jgi:transcription antitermination factor NusG